MKKFISMLFKTFIVIAEVLLALLAAANVMTGDGTIGDWIFISAPFVAFILYMIEITTRKK